MNRSHRDVSTVSQARRWDTRKWFSRRQRKVQRQDTAEDAQQRPSSQKSSGIDWTGLDRTRSWVRWRDRICSESAMRRRALRAAGASVFRLSAFRMRSVTTTSSKAQIVPAVHGLGTHQTARQMMTPRSSLGVHQPTEICETLSLTFLKCTVIINGYDVLTLMRWTKEVAIYELHFVR